MSFNNSSIISHLAISPGLRERTFSWLAGAKRSIAGKVAPSLTLNLPRIAGRYATCEEFMTALPTAIEKDGRII